MWVRALRQGFYRGSRVRPGAEFEMPEADKNMPRWVQPANEPKQKIKSDAERARDAAIATAGPKREGVIAVRDAQGMPLDLDAGAALEEQAVIDPEIVTAPEAPVESLAERNQRLLNELDGDELV